MKRKRKPNKQGLGFCGYSKKKCFRTANAAMIHAKEWMAREESDSRFFRAYHCVRCGFYHLTKKPKVRFDNSG